MTTPLLIGLVLAATAICFVLAPLVWPSAFQDAPQADETAGATDDPLERLRDSLFAQIVELDFEQATGKTDEEEYQQERSALKRRALAVLRTLDERTADASDGADDAIERQVRDARARRAAATLAETDADLLGLDDEVERQISALRQRRGASAARG